MNPNIEYEKFTQEVYKQLLNDNSVKTINVQHNVKLVGKSLQEHQIDVYWEYEITGVKHKVAIECKNYNKEVPIGKVRDFFGVLYDLEDVSGIMVTKIGFQKGAKKFADCYGIGLKELRVPYPGEQTIAKTTMVFNTKIRHCYFLVDEEWAKDNNFNLQGVKRMLDCMELIVANVWANATHIPLQRKDDIIRDASGQTITTFDDLEKNLPDDFEDDTNCTFDFADAYINTVYGLVKIKQVKYEFEEKNQTRVFALDAHDFMKAIVKDAINGEIKLVAKN